MQHYGPRGLHLHYQVGFGYLKRPVGPSNEGEEVIDLATVLDAPFVHINRSANSTGDILAEEVVRSHSLDVDQDVSVFYDAVDFYVLSLCI